jgi:ATP phosphoribosyltransferase
MMSRPLTIAFPKQGRLKKDFTALFNSAGFKTNKSEERHDFGTVLDIAESLNEIVFLNQKPQDAIKNVEIGLADAALVGEDKFKEYISKTKTGNLSLAAKFTFAACSLMIASPINKIPVSLKAIEGARIVTSYPNLLAAHLDEQSVDLEMINIIEREGGVEDYIRLGLADLVCDIVSTGSSLKANGLVPVFNVLNSSAILITKDNVLDIDRGNIINNFINRLKNAQDTLQQKEAYSEPLSLAI